MASPQFHVKFDDFFDTIQWKESLPRSEWQYKARLMKPRVSITPDFYPARITKLILPKLLPKNKACVVDELIQTNINFTQIPADLGEIMKIAIYTQQLKSQLNSQ